MWGGACGNDGNEGGENLDGNERNQNVDANTGGHSWWTIPIARLFSKNVVLEIRAISVDDGVVYS